MPPGPPPAAAPAAEAAAEPPSVWDARLAKALRTHGAAVVVVHTPGGRLDALAVREARAGANAAGAAFVPVDATRAAEVEDLAKAFGVRTTPAVLVMRRAGVASTRFDGWADRDSVAQAAANAGARQP